MPSKFKALAPVGRTPAFDFVGLWALAAAFFILSVVAMKLRQMLE
jgi:hypothetical protein